jgi:hypothetical protein
MRRRWRAAVGCAAMIGLLGITPGWAQAPVGVAGPAAPTPPMMDLMVPDSAHVTLVSPAGIDLHAGMVLAVHQVVDRAAIVTTYTPIKAETKEFQAQGDATLFLPNGIQLEIHQAQIRIVPSGPGGGHRVLITPLATAAAK